MLNFFSKLGLAVLTTGFITSLGTSSCSATNAVFPNGGWTCSDLYGDVQFNCSQAGGNDASCTAARTAIANAGCEDRVNSTRKKTTTM